ncbi:hypothetical protein O6P43_020921 [Quillaja saponaria]|uniref:Uncharacterized protein n=1 Tax=Quillaja saponaria TaxID=32244 RepID=A0AAD7LM48_QUISA|nr:hypothetical protein O6P43_020921 [Quillaja saponaria]
MCRGSWEVRRAGGLDLETCEVSSFNSAGSPSSQVAGIGLQMDWNGSSPCTKSGDLVRVPPLEAAPGGAWMIRQVGGLNLETREVGSFNLAGRPSSQVDKIGLKMDWNGSSPCTKFGNLIEVTQLEAARGGAWMIRRASGLDLETREVGSFNFAGCPSSQIAGIGLKMDWNCSSPCTKSGDLVGVPPLKVTCEGSWEVCRACGLDLETREVGSFNSAGRPSSQVAGIGLQMDWDGSSPFTKYGDLVGVPPLETEHGGASPCTKSGDLVRVPPLEATRGGAWMIRRAGGLDLETREVGSFNLAGRSSSQVSRICLKMTGTAARPAPNLATKKLGTLIWQDGDLESCVEVRKFKSYELPTDGANVNVGFVRAGDLACSPPYCPSWRAGLIHVSELGLGPGDLACSPTCVQAGKLVFSMCPSWRPGVLFPMCSS